MKKLKFILSVFLTVVVFISGCGKNTENVEKTEENKNEIVMAIGTEPEEGFDPCTGWGRYGSPLFQSTLVETDKDMNIINDIAVDYSVSDDRLLWTFDIRDDAYFTDGEKLTAEDVVFTFNTAKSSGSVVDLTVMESVTAVDDDTVQFKLAYPQSAFIYTVAGTGIVPSHLYNESYGENPVGSGPFILKQWDKGQQIILEANENYYGKIPEMKKVTILFMTEDAAFAAAKAGQLDVAVTTAGFAQNEIDGMKIANLQSIDNRGLTLPVVPDKGETTDTGAKIGNNVTSDIAIRRALSYGIDRNMLVENVLNGFGSPAYSECDGMPWGSDEAAVQYDFDKALKILEDSGWIDTDNDGIREKNGLKAEFKLLYNADDSVRQTLSIAVSQEAEKLGIKIVTEGTSWDIIDKEMYSNAVLMGWGAQNPLETYLLYHSDNVAKDYYNPENYTSEITDKYINEAMAEADSDKANELWKKVQWDGETGVSTEGECPWVWLVNVDHLYYVREGLNIGEQKIHPHGHAWPIVSNLREWKWE
ncbi:MAG TPA: ABC transporter substrate-binding protein [Candidatus Fimicola cottocaccae]|nr:ABC transporter substrate-binding protein [Candidatus Fimicola cottocaccae]